MVLFIVATFLIEPWKRRRLVGSFEDKVKLALLETSELQNWKIDEFIKENAERRVDKSTPTTETGVSTAGAATTAKSWFFKLGGDEEGGNTASNKLALASDGLLDFRLDPSSTEESTFAVVKNKLSKYMSPDVKYIQIDKVNLNILFTSSIGIGALLGYTLTYFLTS